MKSKNQNQFKEYSTIYRNYIRSRFAFVVIMLDSSDCISYRSLSNKLASRQPRARARGAHKRKRAATYELTLQ